jgi:hypothetical protein
MLSAISKKENKKSDKLLGGEGVRLEAGSELVKKRR